MGQDHENEISDLEARFNEAGKTGKLGKLNDQIFYAVRYEGGKLLTFPFAKQQFGVLLNLVGSVSAAELEQIAKQLLEYGMAYALCTGEQAEQMSGILDRLIDDSGFLHDGCTPYSDIEEGLSDAMEYFVLPTGNTQTSLIVTVGNDDDHGGAMNLFDNLFGGELEICPREEEEEIWLRQTLKLVYGSRRVRLPEPERALPVLTRL